MIDKYTYDRNETIKAEIKETVDLFLRRKSPIEFRGVYPNWSIALKDCQGYDSKEIYCKTIDAAMAVKGGKAKYERDSVLFYDDNKYFELLYAIERTINQCSKNSIIDFGGGLGSMYFQHRDTLARHAGKIKWNIVEQQMFVEFGKKNLADDCLDFYKSIDEVESIDMAIIGSSLQYIEDYQKYLKGILDRHPYIIFVDRTPMTQWKNGHRIFIENVHKPIYEASYPLYVFDKNLFEEEFLNKGYKKECEWRPFTGNVFRYKDKKVIFESQIWRRDE